MLSALMALGSMMTAGVPPELDAYLQLPNPAKKWHIVHSPVGHTEMKLTSQVWQGQTWTHSLILMRPEKPLGKDQAILYITGDRVDRADLPFIKRLANEARMPVVALFDVPNQPLWEHREDELIAYTFQKYLETGDTTWPLLFPMTKAALAAMDAGGFKKYIVTGASKRGWTTWLTGLSGDPRVAGITPMVFDNLNFKAQLDHQLKSWGKYSEMISDYTESGLTEIMNTEPGQKLTAMVDPYSYLSRLKVPVLCVLGSNDRYWTSDAHSLYWAAIKTPKFLSIVPNEGHNLGDGKQATAAIAFFARGCLGTIDGGLPKMKGDIRHKADQNWMTFTTSKQDFRDCVWRAGGGGSGPPPTGIADFQSVVLKSNGLSAVFSTPVKVQKR